eukprot:756993-Hanusia_phi.AAC.1
MHGTKVRGACSAAASSSPNMQDEVIDVSNGKDLYEVRGERDMVGGKGTDKKEWRGGRRRSLLRDRERGTMISSRDSPASSSKVGDGGGGGSGGGGVGAGGGGGGAGGGGCGAAAAAA